MLGLQRLSRHCRDHTSTEKNSAVLVHNVHTMGRSKSPKKSGKAKAKPKSKKNFYAATRTPRRRSHRPAYSGPLEWWDAYGADDDCYEDLECFPYTIRPRLRPLPRPRSRSRSRSRRRLCTGDFVDTLINDPFVYQYRPDCKPGWTACDTLELAATVRDLCDTCGYVVTSCRCHLPYAYIGYGGSKAKKKNS